MGKVSRKRYHFHILKAHLLIDLPNFELRLIGNLKAVEHHLVLDMKKLRLRATRDIHGLEAHVLQDALKARHALAHELQVVAQAALHAEQAALHEVQKAQAIAHKPGKRHHWTFLFLLPLIAISTTLASAAGIKAVVSNSSPWSVSTTSFNLAPVTAAASPNPNGTALAISISKNSTYYFYLKNFGLSPVTGYSATLSISSSLYYCIGQLFKPSSYNTCADNSAAKALNSGTAGTTFNNMTFTTALPVGSSYEFALRSGGSVGTGNESVTVTEKPSQSHTGQILIG